MAVRSIYTSTYGMNKYISDAAKSIKFSVDGADITGKVELDSYSIRRLLIDDNALDFTQCNPARLELIVTDKELDLTGKYIKVTLDNSIEFYGQISYTKPNDNTNRVKVIAYDNLKRFQEDVSEWYGTLTFPMTLKAFREALEAHIGVSATYDTGILINDDITIEKTIEPSKISAQEILGAICEINAVCATVLPGTNITETSLNYVRLQGTTWSFTGDVLHGADAFSHKSYVTDTINRVQIRNEDGDVGGGYGSGANQYTIQDNFLMYGKTTAQLNAIAQKIYNVVKNIKYTPASIDMKYIPCIQLGNGIQYNGITSLVLTQEISGHALPLSYIEAGGTERQQEPDGIQSDIQQLKGKTNVLTRDVEQNTVTITNLTNKVDNMRIGTRNMLHDSKYLLGLTEGVADYLQDTTGDNILDENNNRIYTIRR